MSNIKLDLKGFKYHSSDDDSTTLHHEKHGHKLTLAHNVLSKDNQAVLKAMADSHKDQPEAQDQHPYGKITHKMAEGGAAHYDNYTAPADANVASPEKSKSPGFKDTTSSSQDASRRASQDASDAEFRKSHPAPAEESEPSGYTNYAKGGQLQGEDSADQKKKDEKHYESEHGKQALKAANMASDEIKHHKKCYACGGEVNPKMYAEGGSSDSNAPEADAKDAVGKAINLTINTGAQPGQQQQPQQLPPAVSSAPPSSIAADPNAPAPQPQDQQQDNSQDQMAQQAPQQPAQKPAAQMQQPQAAAAPVAPTASIPPDVAAQPKAYQQAYADAKQANLQKFAKEDVAWQQDLANGHITPQTYQSLFHDKSTIGKIGTLFGVLLGGFSGLSHQANPVLGMMDKIIANDLQAQEKSKDNAQNYLRLNQQRLLNEANVKVLNTQQKAEAYSLSQAQMLQSSFHSLVDKVSKMPEGPQKELAKQQLGIVQQQVGAKINNVNDMAAGASAYYNTIFGSNGSPAQQNDESQIQKKIQVLKSGALGQQGAEVGHDIEAKHIPGVQGMASRPVPEDIRQRLQAQTVLDNKGKDVLSYVQQHAGTWNPQTRAVAAQKIEEMKNFYNDSIKGGALTQGRLGWYDEQFAKHPTDILSQLMGSTAKLKKMVNSNANRRDLELKGLGFPVNSKQPEPQTKTVNGVKYMRGPNGEAIKVK